MIDRMSFRAAFLSSCIGVLVTVGLLCGCKDMGSDPPPKPTITRITPDSGAVGAEVKVEGSGFGNARGSGEVRFGAVAALQYNEWKDSEIRTIVPSGAQTGTIVVETAGGQSNGVHFTVLGGGTIISYAAQVQPFFNQRCAFSGCHGSSPPSNLFLNSYSQLMTGTSNNGPVVIPGDGEGSKIVMKLRGTATFGQRMPLGGPYLPDSTTQIISDWITQGAQNN